MMERLTAVSPAERTLPIKEPVEQVRPPLVWLVGAHGGAGVTFLTHSLAFAGDCKEIWPDVAEQDISPCAVVVARESTSGLDAAEQALRQWHTDPELENINLIGLVLVAEASGKKRARELSAWSESVAALAPSTFRVAWIPEWTHMRTNELPDWWPGDAVPEKKKKYESDVPATVAELGEHLMTAALAALTEQEEEQ
ncbi:MAG: DUF6668 family protein [Corynebacterium casei]